MKRKILLTGASGMVGKNIRENKGFVNDELLTPEHRELELLNYQSTLEYLKKHRPEFIVHAAGIVGGIQANIQAPSKFLVENLDMGRNLLLAAHEVGIEKVMNIGSSCMYPRGHQEPLKEEKILTGELEPTNEGYALAKITVAKLGQYLGRQYGHQYKTIIPCNLYGRWDKFSPQHSHLVPAIIHKLSQAKKNNEKTVEIWGTGEARREFMNAQDLADFIDYGLANFDKMPDLLNVGLGHDHSVNEYYEAAREIIGWQGEFTHNTAKPVGMQRKLVSIENLEKFGWKSKLNLSEGLHSTFQFYNEYWESGKWNK